MQQSTNNSFLLHSHLSHKIKKWLPSDHNHQKPTHRHVTITIRTNIVAIGQLWLRYCALFFFSLKDVAYSRFLWLLRSYVRDVHSICHVAAPIEWIGNSAIHSARYLVGHLWRIHCWHDGLEIQARRTRRFGSSRREDAFASVHVVDTQSKRRILELTA